MSETWDNPLEMIGNPLEMIGIWRFFFSIYLFP